MPSWKGCQSALLARHLAVSFCLALLAAIPVATSSDAANNTAAPLSAEDWAKAQIGLGNAADFNLRCKTPGLDPTAGEQPAWKDTCRTVSGSFVAALFTQADRSAHLPFAGVQIVGARITGDINLSNAALDRALILDHCRVDGAVSLDDAHTNSAIRILHSKLNGAFSAEALRSDLSLEFGNSSFENDLSIADSKIDGYVDLENANVTGSLNAQALRVSSTLFMGSNNGGTPRFGAVVLNGAKIGGQLSLAGATVSHEVQADSIEVGITLYLNSTVDAKGATIPASFQKVYLRRAVIAGNLDVSGATVPGFLDADGAKIAGSVLMSSANIGHATARFAQVGTTFDIAGALLDGGLDLSGARIAGELHLGLAKNRQTTWHRNRGKDGDLKLLGTHAANLADEEDAWPGKEHLRLDGFTFDRLGSTSDSATAPAPNREVTWWDDWARRDPVYSRTPYQQLAAAFATAGDRTEAEDIRYLGRAREQELEPNCLHRFGLFVLQWIAGFGIGTYTFRVLYCVILISAIGALILRFTGPKAGQHSIYWCAGASLARLLPVIELNKEFTDFFDDSKRANLYRWQNAFFTTIALVGWVLGAILIAAMAGLIQGQ